MVATDPADGDDGLSAAKQALVEVWEAHTRHEFATRSADETMETMSGDPSVNHVPVLTGGVGRNQVREFYNGTFIAQISPDWEIVLVSRTVDAERLVDEMIVRFTHTAHGLDAARNPANPEAGRGGGRRRCRVSGLQGSPRAHLLGPGLSPGPARPS
jgi:hypothetical protein